MNELVKVEQNVTIVPKEFKCANMGIVTGVSEKGFLVKLKYPPKGLKERRIYEFYSHTPNGILFFTSYPLKIVDNELFVINPEKHRFLQRRQFTRVKFMIDTTMRYKGLVYKITTLDLSAGGLKFMTDSSVDLDKEYVVDIVLNEEQNVECMLQPIRMEKKEDGRFVLSGRFVKQSNVDKMTLIQYCMNKNMEAKNK